jgi:hypothetical protein
LPPFIEPKKKRTKKQPTSATRSIRFQLELLDWIREVSEREGIKPNYFVTQCVEYARRVYEAGGSLTTLPPEAKKRGK